MRHKLPVVVIALVVLAFTALADPFELVSNLSSPDDIGVPINKGYYWGQRFTTGTNDYLLHSVTLPLSGVNPEGGEMAGGFFVQVWSNEVTHGTHLGGQPLSILETLSGPDNPESESTQLCEYLSSGLILAPNTDYWIIAGSTLEEDWQYWWASAYSYTGVEGAYLSLYLNSNNQGADWGGTYYNNLKLSIRVEVPSHIECSASELTLLVSEGGSASNRVIDVWNTSLGSVMNYSITSDTPWVSTVPSSGVSTGEHDQVSILFDTDELVSGIYSAALSVTSSEADNSPYVIPVNLWVGITPTNCYVSPSGSHTEPFNTWENAATNIQDAIDTVLPGNGTVIVTNGTYSVSSQIIITNDLVIKSVNGPEHTLIDAGGQSRCINIDSPNVVIDGFTITGGKASHGAGIAIDSVNGVITNCVITGNQAYYAGPAKSSYESLVAYGGGIMSLNCALITDCQIYSNATFGDISLSPGAFLFDGNTMFVAGGGVYLETPAVLENCSITGNALSIENDGYEYYYRGGPWHTDGQSQARGAGICFKTSGTLLNSIIAGNTATCLKDRSGEASSIGGGVYRGSAVNCVISSNTAYSTGEDAPDFHVAAGGGAAYCDLTNCLVVGNSTIGIPDYNLYAAAGGGGVYRGSAINCTIVSNSTQTYGGGSMTARLRIVLFGIIQLRNRVQTFVNAE